MRKTYSDYWGEPTGINWSNYDIHHIRPLAYGGDNSGWNFIPVLRNNHRAITGWFVNY